MPSRDKSAKKIKGKVSPRAEKSNEKKKSVAKTTPTTSGKPELPLNAEVGGEPAAATTTALVPRAKTELQVKAEDAMEKAKTGEINAFEAMRLTLNSMRRALDEPERSGRLPRWMRVVRVGEDGLDWSKRPIGTAVAEVAGGFLFAFGVLQELTLKAIDLLTDIDGGKALVEVGAEMIETISSDEVARSFQYSVGLRKPEDEGKKDLVNPLNGVGPVVETVKTVLRYVPGPEDVAGVAYELYKLQVIHHLDKVEELDENIQVHVDWENTGKARLMSWALGKPIPVFPGGGLLDLKKVDVTYLGSRMLDVQKSKAAKHVKLTCPAKRDDKDITVGVYDITYSKLGEEKDDWSEIERLLDELGYPKEDLKKRLIKFQKENKLGDDGGNTEGSLDLYTIHRLMSMQYNKDPKEGTLKRAKPWPKSGTSNEK